jgi:hypothetical protein
LSDSFGFVSTVAAISTTNSGQNLKNSDFNIFLLFIRKWWTSFFSPNAENLFRVVGKFQYFRKVMSDLNERGMRDVRSWESWGENERSKYEQEIHVGCRCI